MSRQNCAIRYGVRKRWKTGKIPQFPPVFLRTFARCRGEDETHRWEKEEDAACRWHAGAVVRGNRNDERKRPLLARVLSVICQKGNQLATERHAHCAGAALQYSTGCYPSVSESFARSVSRQFYYIFCAVPWLTACRAGPCRVTYVRIRAGYFSPVSSIESLGKDERWRRLSILAGAGF